MFFYMTQNQQNVTMAPMEIPTDPEYTILPGVLTTTALAALVVAAVEAGWYTAV